MILPLLLLAAPVWCAERPLHSSAAPTPAAVVRSKEWVIRRGANREEEFIGDVRYSGGGVRLNSDWALYKHASRTWQARGGVRLERTLAGGDVVSARGDRATHDESTQSGALETAPGRRVEFERVPVSGPPDHGEGDHLSWQNGEQVTISGGARVWGPRLALWSDVARYHRASKRLDLEGGRPVLYKIEGEWTTALKAEDIAATEDPRRITASGKVVGWLIFKDKTKLKELAK